MRYCLYTASLAGEIYDKKKKYERIIITEWKDNTEKSPENGHKNFYFPVSNTKNLLENIKNIKDEEWCKMIYKTYPENTILPSILKTYKEREAL